MDKTKEFIWLADNELRINLNKLASDGINVWLEDEKLKFKGEQGKVTEEALKWMRQNKTAIISYLLEKEEVQDKGFDLTPIQKAYFLGRDNLYELGGISANYYFEIDYILLSHSDRSAFCSASSFTLFTSMENHGTLLKTACLPHFKIMPLSASLS